MKKNTLIVGNWKMQISLKKGRELAQELESALAAEDAEVVVCPPFTHLSSIKTHLRKIKLGAQDLFWEEAGAYTGEISPLTLREIGCSYVIIGHSERRQYLAETDKMANQKVKAALAHSLKPILCVGESKSEREHNQTLEIVEKQLNLALEGVSDFAELIIAYEPIWAVGSGETPDPSDANNIARYLKQVIEKKYPKQNKESVRILYGGSVNGKNVHSFVSQEDLSGVLVGGESVDSDEFIKIIKNLM
ncbi:triose-phosphate isomerase [bacterium (Candidatus Torokbacteria) CG09_land_8_20_14_0_10_42_11]|nr:MAG: triose-phosphate isomerase [bacterium (Candidatus Torokbacteria) CG09_land_8_20_14_0_10_42_11]